MNAFEWINPDTIADAVAALKTAPNEGEMVLQVERGGRLAFVTVRLE